MSTRIHKRKVFTKTHPKCPQEFTHKCPREFSKSFIVHECFQEFMHNFLQNSSQMSTKIPLFCSQEFFHPQTQQHWRSTLLKLKFKYSEKAQKFGSSSTFYLALVTSNYMWKMGQIFVASSEYLNFIWKSLALGELANFEAPRKVRTFWKAHKIWKKTSSCFVHLLSKRPNYKDFIKFCVLLRKSEL